MPTLSELDDQMGEAIDAQFGEAVLLTPRAGRVSGSTPEAGHPAVSIVATYTAAPDNPRAFQDRREGISAKGGTMVSTLTPVLSVSRAEAARVSRPIRQGDLVTLTSRPGTPRYAVNHVDRDDLGALTLDLTKEP